MKSNYSKNCSETALKLLWNCSKTALPLFYWSTSEVTWKYSRLMLWFDGCWWRRQQFQQANSGSKSEYSLRTVTEHLDDQLNCRSVRNNDNGTCSLRKQVHTTTVDYGTPSSTLHSRSLSIIRVIFSLVEKVVFFSKWRSSFLNICPSFGFLRSKLWFLQVF